ncbi:MAG: sigma 54-interacting transcriptional regulator [bacterium]|nr:sigma 54-interacting transcriptional regulator [bacterium]
MSSQILVAAKRPAAPRLLAISPTPECLALAAHLRPHWDEFAVVGAKLIRERLERWATERPGAAATICLADLQEPARVRPALVGFAATGARVLWLARRDSAAVVKACAGVDRVKLCCAATLTEATTQVFTAPGAPPDPAQPDLQDYLRYKINLYFMKMMEDLAPLAEAIETLAALGGRPFALARLAPRDQASLRHFQETDFPYIEGQSAPVLALKRRILALAAAPMSVLITGETGTGKEAVAFYLHEFSARRAGPFVSINCAGLDENHLRSELFGHRQGSFTGAIAHRKGLVARAAGGTLFFDELGDMPLSVQADLLRFLQTRRFRPLGSDKEETADVRLVAAAQPDLFEKLAAGDFRPDLYYRVAEVELATPRLADVPDDIPRIIRNIIYRHRALVQAGTGASGGAGASGASDRGNAVVDGEAKAYGSMPIGGSTATGASLNAAAAGGDPIRATLDYFRAGEPILRAYGWPGNVRELARLVRRRLFVGDDVLPEIERLTQTPAGVAGRYPIFHPIHGPDDIEPARTIMRRYVRHVWSQRGNQTQQEIARRLGLSINTFKTQLADGGQSPSGR